MIFVLRGNVESYARQNRVYPMSPLRVCAIFAEHGAVGIGFCPRALRSPVSTPVFILVPSASPRTLCSPLPTPPPSSLACGFHLRSGAHQWTSVGSR